MDQIPQCDARLHIALKAHQHRLRHIQRHHARSCGKSHQARTGRKGDANREAGMRIASRADRIGQ